MTKYFSIPFAMNGDRKEIPTDKQDDGSISFDEGYGADYEKNKQVDPTAKDISRQEFNSVLHDITDAIGEIQRSGVATWTNEISYNKGATIIHNGAVYTSTINANKNEPPHASWSSLDLSSYRKLDDLLFNGMMKVQATDDVGTGVFLLDKDGNPRGQMTCNSGGLQFAQHREDGISTTYTLSDIGGGLVTDNSLPFTTPEMFGAIGDGLEDDSSAVLEAFNKGQPVFLKGSYKVEGNIPNFRAVQILGSGTIVSNGVSFTPNGNSGTTLSLYTSGDGTGANDGLSPTNPTTLRSAFDYLRYRSLNEIHAKVEINLAGEYLENGFIIQDLPYLQAGLTVLGDGTAVWDGSTSTASYALRTNHTCNSLNITLKNITFQNWSKSVGNSGAFVTDSKSDVLVDGCTFDNVDIGVWVLQSYVKVLNSTFNKCATWGVCVQYNSYGNVGQANNGNTFKDCNVGVSVGRNSISYVEANTFELIGSSAIEANKNSRYRSRGNTFKSWGVSTVSPQACLRVAENAIHNDDNFSRMPDTFELDFSSTQLPFKSLMDGFHWKFHNGQRNSLHSSSNINTQLQNKAGQRILLATLGDFKHPYTLPAYTLYTDSIKMRMELLLRLPANEEIFVELGGAGQAVSHVLARETVKASTVGYYKIDIEIFNYNGNDFWALFYVNGVAQNLQKISETALNNVRSKSEETISWRCYVTPSSNSITTVYGFKSYIEI